MEIGEGIEEGMKQRATKLGGFIEAPNGAAHEQCSCIESYE